MRIGIVSDVFYPYLLGGAERRYWEIARRLARDHEVHAFTMRWHGAPMEGEVDGVRIHRLNVPRGLYSGGRRSIWEALRFTAALFPPSLRDWNFDVIDANQFPLLPLFPSKLMASKNRCPLVATWHEVWGEYWYEYMGSRLSGAIGKGIERVSSRLPDKIIAVSEKTKEGLVEGLGLPPGRISIVPNGVDLELISSIEVEKEENKIVYAGRLLPHKNVDALIRAMPEVLKEIPDAKLTIVGEGPMRERLTRLSRELKIAPNVQFLGDIDYRDVLREMRSSSLLVLPSVREGFGTVLIEAMAARTPVLAVDAAGSAASEVLKGGNGLLCGLDGLEDGILRVLRDGALRERLAEGGYRYSKGFNWDNIAQEVFRVYDAMIKGGG